MEFTKEVTITIDREAAMRYIMENFGDFVNHVEQNAPYDFWKFFDERTDDLVKWITKGGLNK